MYIQIDPARPLVNLSRQTIWRPTHVATAIGDIVISRDHHDDGNALPCVGDSVLQNISDTLT